MRKSKGQIERETTRYNDYSPPVYQALDLKGDGVKTVVKVSKGIPLTLADCPRLKRKNKK